MAMEDQIGALAELLKGMQSRMDQQHDSLKKTLKANTSALQDLRGKLKISTSSTLTAVPTASLAPSPTFMRPPEALFAANIAPTVPIVNRDDCAREVDVTTNGKSPSTFAISPTSSPTSAPFKADDLANNFATTKDLAVMRAKCLTLGLYQVVSAASTMTSAAVLSQHVNLAETDASAQLVQVMPTRCSMSGHECSLCVPTPVGKSSTVLTLPAATFSLDNKRHNFISFTNYVPTPAVGAVLSCLGTIPCNAHKVSEVIEVMTVSPCALLVNGSDSEGIPQHGVNEVGELVSDQHYTMNCWHGLGSLTPKPPWLLCSEVYMPCHGLRLQQSLSCNTLQGINSVLLQQSWVPFIGVAVVSKSPEKFSCPTVRFACFSDYMKWHHPWPPPTEGVSKSGGIDPWLVLWPSLECSRGSVPVQAVLVSFQKLIVLLQQTCDETSFASCINISYSESEITDLDPNEATIIVKANTSKLVSSRVTLLLLLGEHSEDSSYPVLAILLLSSLTVKLSQFNSLLWSMAWVLTDHE